MKHLLGTILAVGISTSFVLVLSLHLHRQRQPRPEPKLAWPTEAAWPLGTIEDLDPGIMSLFSALEPGADEQATTVQYDDAAPAATESKNVSAARPARYGGQRGAGLVRKMRTAANVTAPASRVSPPTAAPPCHDNGPWPCAEKGCPRSLVTCTDMSKQCSGTFSDVFEKPPPGLRHRPVSDECPRMCSKCIAANIAYLGVGGQSGLASESSRVARSLGGEVFAKASRATLRAGDPVAPERDSEARPRNP